MTRRSAISVFLLSLIAAVSCQTPVIGGSCKLGTSDVQIGGKQTQFFLKCEAASDSADGEGVWVVKSRAASPPAQSVPVENSQPQARPPMRKMSNPNICEQDNGARDQDSCAVSATCLQAHNENPTFYLQCDQTNMRWVKKSCQEGFLFNFEQQTCVVPKRSNPINRLPVNPSGLYCTFSSCSSSNPCSSGTCNNGYCCSSGSSSAIMLQPANTGCVGCNQSPPIITIPSNNCPGGGYAVGTCSSGYCSPGYSCVSGSCCPSYNPQPSVRVYTCPSGSPAVGACISGSCASGYSCVSGSCCPSTTTQNPFVCPDGTQAAGGCVNGQCGTGYTCSNGLCCAGTSNTVRCLDGSEAVGACIPSCQGNACGGSTVSYYCGSGYTCTTGNICCAINSCPNGGDVLGPTVNGLCPTGYVAQGSICCSALCADGSAGGPLVNGACPTGQTVQNGVCCSSTTTDVSCSADIAAAQGCVNGACADIGYACDTATQTMCCPVVRYDLVEYQLGPGVGGLCPLGYAIVYIPDTNIDADGNNQGTCVSLQSIPGICDVDVQNGPCQTGTCSTGYYCFTTADICCPTTTAFRKLRPGQRIRPSNQKPSYGRSLQSYMPPRKDLTCPDGSPAGGACMNGLCGIGHDCINGLCCPPQSSNSQIELKSVCPNGKTAVSGCFTDGTCGFGFECVKSQSLCCPPGGNDVNNNNNNFGNSGVSMTIRPIGARCHQDSECVGHVDGLSMCHAGVCQCSPIAYSQGIACVRRKALNMMMNDQPMEVEKTNGVAASN